jgi:hypothetical protein
LKFKEGIFLRPLRSKDDPLYDKQFQISDLFVFFIVPARLTLVGNAKRKISKSNKLDLWNRFSYRGLSYFFEVGSQTLRNDCKILRLQPQNSGLRDLNRPLTSMASKTALPYISKIASNQCICSKD